MIGNTHVTKRRSGRKPNWFIRIVGFIAVALGAVALAPSVIMLNCRPGQTAWARVTVFYGKGRIEFTGMSPTRAALQSAPILFLCEKELPCEITVTAQGIQLNETIQTSVVWKSGPTLITRHEASCGAPMSR